MATRIGNKKKTSKDLPESTLTRMQELGSAWVFNRAIQDNKGWQRWEHLKTDKETFPEIQKVWKTIGKVEWDDKADDPWLESFYKQQRVLLRNIGRPSITEFTRDGNIKGGPKYILPGNNSGETFMEWVEKYLKSEFKIGTKDNWNPADIWLIQDEKKWKKKIEDCTKVAKKNKATIIANLTQFNKIFRALFRTKQIIGISLKKIGGSASWKEVNVSHAYFKKIEATTMELTGVKCLLGTTGITAKEAAEGKGVEDYNKIETQDAWLFIKDNNENIEYKVQIKGNTTSRKSNLKFEPTEVGKGAARMGKATREYIFDLMKSYGIKRHFPESADNYPLTEDEFKGYDPKTLRMIGNQKAYVKMLKDIRTIMGSQNVDYGVDPITGVINLAEVFSEDSQPWIANMKLQEIRFIWAIVAGLRTKEKINKFCTDLIYIAAKQGRKSGPYGTGYGPFGKIY